MSSARSLFLFGLLAQGAWADAAAQQVDLDALEKQVEQMREEEQAKKAEREKHSAAAETEARNRRAKSQAAAEARLTGDWEGTYSYPAGVPQPPVKFWVKLEEEDGKLTGSVSEPNTFGSQAASFLSATIAGTRDGNQVVFQKTYDGSAGVGHSVDYRGTFAINAQEIVGVWAIGNVSGDFRIARVK